MKGTELRRVGLFLLTAALALGGCASSWNDDKPAGSGVGSGAQGGTRPEQDMAGGGPFIVASRLDVVGGRPLLLAMDASVDASPRVELPDGREIEATLYRVEVREAEPKGDEGVPDTWLGSRGVWRSTVVEDGEGRGHQGAGITMLVIELPAEGAGNRIIIGGRAYALNHVPSPAAWGNMGEGAGNGAWAAGRPEAMPESELSVARFSAEGKFPLTRWRYRLLSDGLHPEAPAFSAFVDPLAEAVAQREEDLWRVALARLWDDDAELAGRLKARLCASVEFAPGVWAPAWYMPQAMVERLRSELLDPSLDARGRRVVTERWLNDAPRAVSWIIDDGGTVEASRRHLLPSVGIASLWDRGTLSWSRWEGAQTGPELEPLAAHGSRGVVMAPGPLAEAGVARLWCHAGEWSQAHLVRSRPAPVTPPGAVLGPFFADWSMQGWMQGAAGTPEEGWTTAALVYKLPDEPGAGTGVRSRGWEIYVECKAPAGEGDWTREKVLIYCGPFGRPTAVLSVLKDGTVERVRPSNTPEAVAEIMPPPTRTMVARAADRWSFRVALPPGSIEHDGLLRIGVTRVDALGRRAASPRPMMPWQQEPARVALETNAWSGVEEPERAAVGP